MTRTTRLATLFALGLTLSDSASARASAEETFELWFALPTTVDIGDARLRPQLWFDAHVRRGSPHTELILRPGVGVVLRDWVNVHAGYAWTPRFDDATDDVRHEHRIWQQVTFNLPSCFRVSTTLRTRLEQRFREGGDDVGLRVWQLARFGYRFVEGKPLGVVLQDQIFFHLNDADWGPRAGFDQNRLFAGPTVDIAGLGRLEVGYMFLYQDRSAADLIRHILFGQLILGF